MDRLRVVLQPSSWFYVILFSTPTVLFAVFREFTWLCRHQTLHQGYHGFKYWLHGNDTTDAAEDYFTAEFNKGVSFI